MNPYLILIICIPVIIVALILSYKYSRSMSAKSFIRFTDNKDIDVKPEEYNEWIPIKTWLVKGKP